MVLKQKSSIPPPIPSIQFKKILLVWFNHFLELKFQFSVLNLIFSSRSSFVASPAVVPKQSYGAFSFFFQVAQLNSQTIYFSELKQVWIRDPNSDQSFTNMAWKIRNGVMLSQKPINWALTFTEILHTFIKGGFLGIIDRGQYTCQRITDERSSAHFWIVFPKIRFHNYITILRKIVLSLENILLEW